MARRDSQETRWHKEILNPNSKLLRHPAYSDEWKKFNKDNLDFAADPRNLRLGLATDGFNPFGNMINSYNVASTHYTLQPGSLDMHRSVELYDGLTDPRSQIS
jgi:hypothetical protein